MLSPSYENRQALDACVATILNLPPKCDRAWHLLPIELGKILIIPLFLGDSTVSASKRGSILRAANVTHTELIHFYFDDVDQEMATVQERGAPLDRFSARYVEEVFFAGIGSRHYAFDSMTYGNLLATMMRILACEVDAEMNPDTFIARFAESTGIPEDDAVDVLFVALQNLWPRLRMMCLRIASM